MSNETYSKKEQTCKGCFGPCGRCDERELTAADLALFLGCEVEWMGERGYKLTGINTGDEYINPVGLKKDELHYWANLENVRPVLRPLSDITKSEQMYIRYIIDSGPKMQDAELWARLSAYIFQRQIDVFNWIPAGLAIDATKKEEI